MRYVWTWLASGVAHMVVGGYICYRFRAQIDAIRAKVEYGVDQALGGIPYVSKAVAGVWNFVMSKVGR
jgi:hypothetical protein